jgi:hypothetical protein
MTNMDAQFYPTPPALAARAWAKFKNRHFSRILEPSAGEGDLVVAAPFWGQSHRRIAVDVIELDVSKHAGLREKGLNVVGVDFLDFEGCEIYSHVCLNPPFAAGSQHTLKVWDGLWEGEIVAILNAETIRNPFSAERMRLVRLIQEHGSVEFIQEAFMGQDVQREADVEIALVHLTKAAETREDWIGPIIALLAQDDCGADEHNYELPLELALPATFVSSQVSRFRLAVKAMRESVKMQAVATHYAAGIGRTMAGYSDPSDKFNPVAPTGAGIRKAMEERYVDLKDRAWASILRSTEALSKLSAKIQKQAESQFEDIKKLDFTESNVYGFLLGLVQSQPQMQDDMMCDVFDQITRFHTDNTVFYKGWRSNDLHRTCGFRIKTTRFILPGHSTSGYETSMPWQTRQMLSDFDKVFAMLDGKAQAEFGLLEMTRQHFKELRHGQRVDSDYFSLRYYPQAGTLHFFARRKDLVDRLNRFVGRLRRWLPPDSAAAPDAFWKQFDCAEKFDAEVRAAAAQLGKEMGVRSWRDPLQTVIHGEKSDGFEAANQRLCRAMDSVLAKHGLLDALAWDAAAEPLLLTA